MPPPPPATAIARCNVALCLANWREVISKQRNSSGTWAFRWRTPTSVVKSQHPGKGILIKSVGISLLQGVLVPSRIPSYTKQASSTSPSHILLFAFLFQYCLITERDISGLVFRFKPIRPSWHVFCYPCVPLLESIRAAIPVNALCHFWGNIYTPPVEVFKKGVTYSYTPLCRAVYRYKRF